MFDIYISIAIALQKSKTFITIRYFHVVTFTEKRRSKRACHIKMKENRMYQVVLLYIFHRVILGVSVYKTEIVVIKFK